MIFVRAANPIWFMVDLVGQALNDEYYAFFLTNTLPYLPQNIYRDPQGVSVWPGNIVQFLPNGTLPDNLYFDPTLVYRIEIRHGNTQADALIYEINNFVPENGSGGNLADTFANSANQISNGRFSQVLFTNNLVINSAGTYNIAPGWNLILTGIGSSTLTQLSFSGSGINTSPDAITFALRIANTGWTDAILSQTFDMNGSIWSGGAIALSMDARGQGASELLSLNYVPSDAGTPITVKTGTVTTGNFQQFGGVANVVASTNTDNAANASVSINIVLPTSGIVDLTNVQAVGQSNSLDDPTSAALPTYQQETEERNIDHLFHYYANDLITKPKKSLLVGWNFPINPYQFRDPTPVTITSQVSYIADQTILYQEAASQLQAGQGAPNQRFNLEIKAVTGATTTRFALIQYITGQDVSAYWSYIVSSLARVRIFTTHGTSVRLKARLIYRATLPSSISPTEPIASWAANSDPVFSAGWTAIEPLNDPAYLIANDYDSSENTYPGYGFEQFQLPSDAATTMTLGIVIYTMDNLNSTSGTEDSINFDAISLIPSSFAADALPQTSDDCLRECQLYYETSYSQGVPPGTLNAVGARTYPATLTEVSPGNFNVFLRTFGVEFNSVKIQNPTMTFYSPTNVSANTVQVQALIAGVQQAASPVDEPTSSFTQTSLSKKSVIMTPTNNTALLGPYSGDGLEARYIYHYIADARLGV